MPLVSGAQRNRGQRGTSPSQSRRGQPGRAVIKLPEYEPPSCPLNDAARRALAELCTHNADTRKYEEQLKKSVKSLTDSISEINDRHRERKEASKAKRSGRAQSAEEEEEDQVRSSQPKRDDEDALHRLSEAVPQLSADCEAAVREVIDLRVELEDGRSAIQSTTRKVEFESANARNRDGQEGEDDVMGNTQPDIIGPLRILRTEKEKAAADYARRSLEERYARDNDYVGFKRLWWDAVHGAEGKPLPDASRWFRENHANDEEEEDEEDEDLVVAGEQVSIYCPLSMVVMDEPFTSTRCRHTFNKPAIVQFLRSQPNRTAQCPQTGCSRQVNLKDFFFDQVMLRKIKRAQAEKERDDSDDDDDDAAADGDSQML
ncbi:hypothetical protein GGS20DRAFT_150734 [Poronia punctata]|nr:hypothetical protein GGS20DRAFT_150734 [Poronia punctata]